MGNFFAELKRRHIYRVAAAYAVVAWLLVQLFNNLTPLMKLPEWAGTLVLVLLVGGFPLALIFAWVLELKAPEGPVRTGASDWVLAGVAAAVIAIFAYQQLAPSRPVSNGQAGIEAARAAAASPAGISVVVLPFLNLSSDKEQEFFSDGVTEDIITALAKIPDLRVVARESAFQYKGEKNDMRTVGRTLNATHIIGGSVRKVGTRVRITAQLVKADDGLNIWADSYDRELTDVFAIQEEIARAIATSLRMPLGIKPGDNLVSARPKDQRTYELYLRGVNALRQRTRRELDLLEQVVALDPTYAPGWAKLAEARREMSLYYERGGEDSKVKPLLDGAQAAARKSITLAPDYAGGYGALAPMVAGQGKQMEAMDLIKQGLARDADEPELLANYASALTGLGYLKEALEVRERLSLLEPLIPLFNRQRAQALLANGQTDAGESELQSLGRQNPQNGLIALLLATSYAQQGRFAEAAELFDMALARPNSVFTGVFTRPLVEAAAQALHAATNKTAPPKLPDFYSELNFIYAYTASPERMLDWPEKALKEGTRVALDRVWWPTPSSVRKTERFKTLSRNAGLVDYWRARGWPDLCRPMGANDFVCD